MGKSKKNKPAFYHGGFPGLPAGKRLRGYADTSISLRRNYSEFDPKRIFVTTSIELATAYALHFAQKAPELVPNYKGAAQGSVYEVTLTGKKHVDEDFEELAPSKGGLFSFYILDPPVIKNVIGTYSANPSREYKLFAPFQTWESRDGAVYPLWNSLGYMNPALADAAQGRTWQDIEAESNMGRFSRDRHADSERVLPAIGLRLPLYVVTEGTPPPIADSFCAAGQVAAPLRRVPRSRNGNQLSSRVP